MTRKLTLSITAAMLATAGVAVAAPAVMPKGDVTRAQAEAKSAEMFARMDVNRDGKLDQSDRAARRAQMFDRLDTDKNGQISRAEFAAAADDRGDKAGMKGHHRGGRGMYGAGMAMAKRADTNGDGAISPAEFSAGALKMFDTADTNRDGTVTQAERQAAREAMKLQWRQARPATPHPAQ